MKPVFFHLALSAAITAITFDSASAAQPAGYELCDLSITVPCPPVCPRDYMCPPNPILYSG